MKRLLLFFLLLSTAALSFAQDYALSGKWREVRRTDLAGNAVNMSDTIRMDFLTGQEYTWLKKGGFMYRGTYKVENGALDMGSRYFTIVEQSPNRIVIKDDGATYEFAPYVDPPRATIAREAIAAPVADITTLAGKWEVYKGTSTQTMKEIDYTTKVKNLMIFDTPDPDGNIGYITARKDPEGRPSWKVSRYANNILYANGRTARQFQVIKADQNELILKEGPITYFLKQFTE
jgi:hypothetical protein